MVTAAQQTARPPPDAARAFPKGFLFGLGDRLVYQIEGAASEDGRGRRPSGTPTPRTPGRESATARHRR